MQRKLIIFLVVLLNGMSMHQYKALASNGIIGEASWYSSEEACGKKTNDKPGCPTASGKGLFKLERSSKLFVAVNGIALGKEIRFTNIKNGKSVKAMVVDRGGFDKKYGRIADLGKKAFSRLADPREGTIQVKMEIL